MDFNGMKRRDLQTLCKKHGIPANLKNTEMASRLSSLFEMMIPETDKDISRLPEDGFHFEKVVRRSTRLAAKNAKPCVGDGTSKGGAAKGSQEERKTMQSKRPAAVNSRKDELVKRKTNEPLLDCEAQKYRRVSELLVDGHALKGDRQPKRTDIQQKGKTLDEYAQFEQEEACGADVEARGSSKKSKTENQGCIKDKPQGTIMIEDSPSSSEAKAAESVMIIDKVLDPVLDKSVDVLKENPQGMADDSPSKSETKATQPKQVLDSSLKVSVDIALVRNTQELSSELMEEEREEKQEQYTVLMAATKKDKQEASSLSEFLIERPEVSIPQSELGVPTGHILVKDISEEVPKSVHSFVAKLAETEAVLEKQSANPHGIFSEYITENSSAEEQAAGCCNESLSSKDDERNRHGSFSEYNTENSSAEKQAEICKIGRISTGHCVNREMLDEVNDDSLTKFERTISSERDCKPNALELSSLSTDSASLSSKEENLSEFLEEENVSECLEEDEKKALSLPIPINKAASNALDGSSVFTTPERNLMLMEELSESGKIRAATIVKHNDEAVEFHDVVFTTPEQVLLLGDSVLDQVGKEEDHTAADLPDRSDVHNTRQIGAVKEGILVELHEESSIVASPLRQSSVGDFKGDGTVRNEGNKSVELHCESGTCTSPNRLPVFESSLSDGAEDSRKAAREGEVKLAAQIYEVAGLSTGLHKDTADKSALCMSLERQLLYGDSENKYRANKDAELSSVSNISTNLERHLLSGDCGLDGTRKVKDNAASCDESFVFISPERRHHVGKEVEFKNESAFFTRLESRLLLGESGQDRLGNSESGSSQYQSHDASSPKAILKDDSVVSGSHVSTLDLGESTIAASRGSIVSKVSYSHEFNAGEATAGAELMPKSSMQATSKQSRGNSPHLDSVNLFDFDIEGGDAIMDAERKASFSSYVLALPAQGNSETTGEISSPFEVAGTCPLLSEESSPSTNIRKQINDSLEESSITDNNEAVELIESKVSRRAQEDFRNTCENSGRKILHDDATGPIATPFRKDNSLTPNEFTVQDKINEEGLDATQQTSKQRRGHSEHVTSVNLFDSDIEGTETTMEAERNVSLNSSHLEVGGTCSMKSEESAPSTDIQKQIHDAPRELAKTDNNDADELMEAKVTKSMDSSGGFSISGKTCVLAVTEDEHFVFTKDEATDPNVTAFEKDISLTPDGFTIPNNKSEEAADEEMVRREATPNPEETLSESSESRKEHVNIGESCTSSESEKQVRRGPMLIYGTQVKAKRHDMKENAPNSKIVDNLNVTAPRTSRRQPLQDLRKN